jgi:predicted alpha-1,2-mannosidase
MKIKQLYFLSMALMVLNSCSAPSGRGEKPAGDNTAYVDPTIGYVSRFLVPTYPTFHLPNQMLRMIPVKADYISDEVTAFPLQVHAHRNKGMFRMKVGQGDVTRESWKRKMVIDHDLEIMHPWHYSTYLIEEDIRVSFTPGAKCGIYHIEFPGEEQRNLLIGGTVDMRAESNKDGSFSLRDKIIYVPRGIFSVTREMGIYVHAVLTGRDGEPVDAVQFKSEEGRVALQIPAQAASEVLLKYAVSYIGPEQARENYEKEVSGMDFDQLSAQGKKIWQETLAQIRVEGGTEAQRRTFYTSLYRTYERMVDINEYGRYYSGYDGQVHESERPFFVDDWIWDTYLAHHPLRTILHPDMQNDVLHSYTQMYEQSGWMPTFPSGAREPHVHECLSLFCDFH